MFVLHCRTSDLASPCSFGSSLLDRILGLLPQTPIEMSTGEGTAEEKTKVRCSLSCCVKYYEVYS
jgi:hypothetical protein